MQGTLKTSVQTAKINRNPSRAAIEQLISDTAAKKITMKQCNEDFVKFNQDPSHSVDDNCMLVECGSDDCCELQFDEDYYKKITIINRCEKVRIMFGCYVCR